MPHPVRNDEFGNRAQATLEVHIARTGIDRYSATFRFSSTADDALSFVRGTDLLQFSAIRATDAAQDPVATGDQLTKELLADESLAAEFRRILAVTETKSQRLHVRFVADASAAELQLLPWEALRHPDRPEFLFLGERMSFSRFLQPTDSSSISPLALGKLSAAIFIANPENLDEYDLPPLDVSGWRAAAQEALQGLNIKELPAGRPVTLAAIIEAIRSGTDVLYLACHGSSAQSEAILWLADEDGRIARVPGAKLVEEIRSLLTLPRLVVLFSCGSAGDDVAFQAAVGPALAAAGVPAVVAMRGDVPLRAGSRFVQSLLLEVRKHGIIQEAVASARRAMGNDTDALLPVLFSRLRDGRVWYKPGFLSDGQFGDRWRAMIEKMDDGQCVPIVGPGLAEPLFGTTRELARSWSENYGFPLSRDSRDNLAQVAQYLVISQYANLPRDLLEKHIRASIAQYLRDVPPSEMSLFDRINAAWLRYASEAENDPYRQLADMPFPLYFTTNSDGILEHALSRAGREPVSEVCRWDGKDLSPTVFERNPDYHPCPERPLVYHLFRMLKPQDRRFPSSLITEDNYFDYLLGVTNRRELIPSSLRTALSDSALLFLGFQIDELDFRVLFRSIITQESLPNVKMYNHVAVQIDPEEGQIIEANRARRYLTQYFEQLANVSVYWGSGGDFVAQMYTEWQERREPGAAPAGAW